MDRIKQNVGPALNKTLAPRVNEPSYWGSDAPKEESLSQSFLNRIKEKAENVPVIQNRLLDARAPLDENLIKYRIRYAGSSNFLLLMRYNNVWRNVEPYSYRWRGAKDEKGRKRLLFFGFCLAHNQIHAFRLDKIQGLIVTDQTYSPRWRVEVA